MNMLDNPASMFTSHRPQPLHSVGSLGSGRPRLLAWARRVMLLFVLSVGVAIASPILHPQSFELVCSANGAIKTVVHTDDGVQELGMGQMDCPLCMLTGPLPTPPAVALPAPLPLSHAVQSIPATRIAAATAAPLPARGPPTIS